MGLSSLDCPRCGHWDDDGDYPTAHGSRAIELSGKLAKAEGRKEWSDICDKCFKELTKKGAKVYYMAQRLRYVKVYDKDPKVEYGSILHVQCKLCYQHYDPKEYKSCPYTGTDYHKALETREKLRKLTPGGMCTGMGQ